MQKTGEYNSNNAFIYNGNTGNVMKKASLLRSPTRYSTANTSRGNP